MSTDATSGASAGPAPAGRWYFLDWLRATAIVLVFLFHCGRFFDHIWWHLKDGARDLRFTIATLLLAQWGMPLFFLVAGAAAALAPPRRGGGGTRARALRLVVPFVFGVLVIVPPQVYFERLATGGFDGSYAAFYPHYFDGLYFLGGNFSWFGHHLWFLLALFAVSVAASPVVAWLRRSERIPRLATAMERTGPLVFFGAPVFVLQVALRGVGAVDPVAFVLFYLYGVLLASEPRFLPAIRATGNVALAAAVATSAGYAALFAAGLVALEDLAAYRSRYALAQVLAGVSAWAWPHALLALYARFANRDHPARAVANDAVMPCYVLHQTFIIAIGYYVIAAPLGTLAKFAVIAATAFVATAAVYALAIRPLAPIRVLFGMKRAPGG